ncbi:hypothetical protein P376_1830 [Streptomyces sp. HCCB10043]|nr:hypothetical protein P376_1830 [Streptomyces sp. HCCB10043]
MQEVQGELLIDGAGAELVLPGRGDRRVHEEEDVLGGDEVGGAVGRGHHGRPPGWLKCRPGNGGANDEIIASQASLGSRTGVPRPAPET